MRQPQTQTGGDVNVEVNAARGQDLIKMLTDMKQEYEQIIEKDPKEDEKWYEVKISYICDKHPSYQRKEKEERNDWHWVTLTGPWVLISLEE